MIDEMTGNDSFGQREEIARVGARIHDALDWSAKWLMRIAFLAVSTAMTVAACGACSGCTAAERGGAVNAIFAAADVACIIAHVDLPNEAAIADACALSHDLEPIIKTLVAEQKSAIARAKVAACK